MLVAEDCEERDRERGGLRRDLRVIFNDGVEPGLETEGSGFRIGFIIRERVYCVYDREPWLVPTVSLF